MISNIRFKAIDDLKNLRAEVLTLPKPSKQDDERISKLAEENKLIKIGIIKQTAKKK
tara:strand:- start:8658 stop:8828 length:171 start_codon:yes stop_codon:yes gene_type:complete